MDTQDNAGSGVSFGQYLRDFDILGRTPSEIARGVSELAYSRPEAFTALAKAIAPGNRALEDQILRMWGIRRC